jgi:hypothetical protein
MSLFGHKGCNVRRYDKVIIRRKHADMNVVIAEQLTTQQAKKVYKDITTLYKDKKTYIEFENTKGDQWFLPKHEVAKIIWDKRN